jgi:TetR/AcrR family transcriptional repressor of nem operon
MNFVPKSETTRKLIIEKTAKLFNKQGYAGTSISDISEAMQLTKGSIYGNFKDKEDIAFAAFEYNLSWIKNRIETKISQKKTFKGKLLANVDIYTECGQEINDLGGCPMMNTAIDADDTHPGMKKMAADAMTYWKQGLKEILREGIKNREFRYDINIDQTALTIIALIEGAVLIGRTTGNKSDRAHLLQAARDVIKGLE